MRWCIRGWHIPSLCVHTTIKRNVLHQQKYIVFEIKVKYIVFGLNMNIYAIDASNLHVTTIFHHNLSGILDSTTSELKICWYLLSSGNHPIRNIFITNNFVDKFSLYISDTESSYFLVYRFKLVRMTQSSHQHTPLQQYIECVWPFVVSSCTLHYIIYILGFSPNRKRRFDQL